MVGMVVVGGLRERVEMGEWISRGDLRVLYYMVGTAI